MIEFFLVYHVVVSQRKDQTLQLPEWSYVLSRWATTKLRAWDLYLLKA